MSMEDYQVHQMSLQAESVPYTDLLDLHLQATHLIHRHMHKKDATTWKLQDMYTKSNSQLKYWMTVDTGNRMKVKSLEDKIVHQATQP